VAEYIKEAKQISCAARTSVSGINFKDTKKSIGFDRIKFF
jgi:hypothetical protein